MICSRRRLGEPKLLPQEEVTYAEPVLIPPNKVIHGSPKATLRHAPMPPMGFTQFQPNNAQDSYYSQQQNIRDHFGTLRSQREHKVNIPVLFIGQYTMYKYKYY